MIYETTKIVSNTQIHVCSSSVYQRFSWLPYWELIPLFPTCLSGEITFLWDAVLPLFFSILFLGRNAGVWPFLCCTDLYDFLLLHRSLAS